MHAGVVAVKDFKMVDKNSDEYIFLITKDHISDGADEGAIGSSGVVLSPDEIKSHPDRIHFKMYDDDAELYYEGFSIGGQGFEPLDDFGMPNAGCTDIKQRNKETGKYESL